MKQPDNKKSVTETHFQVILDSIVDGVFTVDKNLKITFFNQAAEKITGISRDNAIGLYCFEALRANICENKCPLRQVIQTGKDVINQAVNILRTDSKQIPISVNATPLKDKNGKIIGGVESFRDLSAIETLRKEIQQKYTFEDIISKNHKMLDLFSILPNIAESESTVLIQGPSGSGKELFARALHNLSCRKDRPFVAVNCGALPDSLLDSELFGYIKGAFTDAKKNKPGRFKLAEGGTIFLDEVESLSPATQVKLLRVLQEKEYEPLGSTSPCKSNVRVISACKAELLDLVEADKFRDDLYFRLNVVKIKLPSLNERREDIPLLIEHFIEKYNHKMGKSINSVSREVLEILVNYDYPGNIRELENIIEHAFVMCPDEEIKREHISSEIYSRKQPEKVVEDKISPLQNSERKTILEVLKRNNWNKVKTAKELDLHRSTLWRKMKEYRLN